MDAQNTSRLGARHLSQIREESDSREQSTCFLPPIVQQQTDGAGGAGGAGEPGVDEADRPEVRRLSDAASPQRRLEEHSSLLQEWGRIEAELRCEDVERQREASFLRRQENILLRTHLCYLILGQRVAKPWVSSYFRRFPMHIYCLPVQPTNHRSRRRGPTKRT